MQIYGGRIISASVYALLILTVILVGVIAMSNINGCNTKSDNDSDYSAKEANTAMAETANAAPPEDSTPKAAATIYVLKPKPDRWYVGVEITSFVGKRISINEHFAILDIGNDEYIYIPMERIYYIQRKCASYAPPF